MCDLNRLIATSSAPADPCETIRRQPPVSGQSAGKLSNQPSFHLCSSLQTQYSGHEGGLQFDGKRASMAWSCTCRNARSQLAPLCLRPKKGTPGNSKENQHLHRWKCCPANESRPQMCRPNCSNFKTCVVNVSAWLWTSFKNGFTTWQRPQGFTTVQSAKCYAHGAGHGRRCRCKCHGPSVGDSGKMGVGLLIVRRSSDLPEVLGLAARRVA